jgi:hypothetical protein
VPRRRRWLEELCLCLGGLQTLAINWRHFEQAPRVDRPPLGYFSISTLIACHSGAALGVLKEDVNNLSANCRAQNAMQISGMLKSTDTYFMKGIGNLPTNVVLIVDLLGPLSIELAGGRRFSIVAAFPYASCRILATCAKPYLKIV